MIADTLKSIYSIAEKIYGQYTLVKANQEQCGTLTARIRIIEAAIRKLGNVKDGDGDHYLPGLQAVERCLNACNLFMQKFSSEHWFIQVVKAGSFKKDFEKLNAALEEAASQLQLGFGAQNIIDRRRDKEDQQKDVAYILKQMKSIEKLYQKHLEKLSGVEAKLEEHRFIQAQQHASIRARLIKLTEDKAESEAKKEKPLISRTIAYHEWASKGVTLAESPSGTVVLAKWREQNVSVKLLNGDYSEDDLKKLIREIKILGRLSHGRIVQFYGACIDNKYPFVVTEYLEKGSLKQVLQKEKFTKIQQKNLALAIAQGLHYLHTENIVHRDFTSGCILLNGHGEAKITDFCLSKGKTASIASVKESSSSVAWQAPECLKQMNASSTQSDTYSFGVVLWEICTGKTPFAEIKDDATIIKAICAGKRDAIPKEIPDAFRSIITACWHPVPSERPQLLNIIQQLEALTPEALMTDVELYQEGQRLERVQEYKEAARFYELASKKDFVKADTCLGVLLAEGKLGKPDRKGAYCCFFKAASADHVRAMSNLASLLKRGVEGVENPSEKMLYWYEMASKRGDKIASAKLEELRSAGPVARLVS